MRTEFDATEFDTRADEPCVTWERGNLRGSLYHSPWPEAMIAGVTYYSCERCGRDLGLVEPKKA